MHVNQLKTGFIYNIYFIDQTEKNIQAFFNENILLSV